MANARGADQTRADLRQRRLGAKNAGRAFDDGAFERAGLHGGILGKETRQCDAGRRFRAEAQRRQRLLRQQTAAGRKPEQPQIGRGAGQCRVGVLVEAAEHPLRGARQAFDRFLKPHRRPAERRIVVGFHGLDDAAQFLDHAPRPPRRRTAAACA